jgi:type IV secretion system protein VirD4
VSLLPDLKSVGFNPLLSLDPASPTFFDDAAGIADALIRIEGKDPHWSESAQGLLVALIMWEVIVSRREHRSPSLEQVRFLLTQPDKHGIGNDGKKHLVDGLRVTAIKMCSSGNSVIASLTGRFLRENDEMSSIQSTADTQTRWLLSEPMRADLKKNGIGFRTLKDEAVTVYVILPAEYIDTHSAWTRLVMTVALRSLYRPGGIPVLFMADEAYSLGRLKPIEGALGLARGYNLQIMPVLQSLIQLKQLYEDSYENFLGQAGTVIGFGPNDMFTADWMSRRSGETSVRQPNISANQNQSGAGTSASESYGRRRYLLPQDLFGQREGFGFIWCAGQARPIPTYLPPYWHIEKIARRARQDPYHLPDAEE